MNERRLTQVRALLSNLPEGDGSLDGLYVASPENRYYLTGFSGSSGHVLITADRALLFTDFRYVEQAGSQAPLFEIVEHGTPPTAAIHRTAQALGVRRLGFEAAHLSVEQHAKLAAALGGIDLVSTSDLVETLRATKEPDEISRIEIAVACADAAFEAVLGMAIIQPGVAESEIAIELEHQMRRRGASKAAFDTIVASGPRAALPHGRASERRIASGDFVTMDLGAVVAGYCSDITRTVVVGQASDEQRELYALVLRAQIAGIAAVRPGVTGREVDAAARQIIEAAGHGARFGHGLGHGLGLAVHEAPRLSPVGEAVLEPGMVTSVEPGVYLPGWGGVRIEDVVLVTPDGCRVLTKAIKELIEA